MRILVTGGLGFIGSALVRLLIKETKHEVFNVDKISYASTFGSVADVVDDPRYSFLRCDLVDAAEVDSLVKTVNPEIIMHLAAESHVDRSIDGPKQFVDSNIIGTFNLLQAARELSNFERFVHVSTDEVFGSLPLGEGHFNEDSQYSPHSPYSATKAASDHLVRAWGSTYDLPISVTNCSNNYGPFQFPEKLIPLMIIRALEGMELPVYGNGENVRDWLYVEDHVRALLAVAEEGVDGRTYAIGGNNERSNLDLVHLLCDLIDQKVASGQLFGFPIVGKSSRRDLISFVSDRPGHDLRYAIDSSRISEELGWKPSLTFEEGLDRTLNWYLNNLSWWQPIAKEQGAVDRLGSLTPST